MVSLNQGDADINKYPLQWLLFKHGVSPYSATYIARMSDKPDAKQILTASPPLGELENHWDVTQQDLESLNLSLYEATDTAQNHPLWRMMSTFGTTHSQWCMAEMNEWMNNMATLSNWSGVTTIDDVESLSSSTIMSITRSDESSIAASHACSASKPIMYYVVLTDNY